MAKLRNRYADVLLEISEKRGSLEKDTEQVTMVRDTLESDEVQSFLANPHIPAPVKDELFQNAFSDELAGHVKGFLSFMVGKKRETLIIPALTEYIDSANRRSGRIEAKVVSAKALTKEQIESIRRILARQTSLEIMIENKVDPDVIGGFYILMEGHIFDCTVRTELNKMKERLKRGMQ